MRTNIKFIISMLMMSLALISCGGEKKTEAPIAQDEAGLVIDPASGVQLSLFIEEKDRTYPLNVELMTNIVRNAFIALKWNFNELKVVSKIEKDQYKLVSLYSSPMYDVESGVPDTAGQQSNQEIVIGVRTFRAVGNKTILDFTVYNSTNETEIKKIMNILASQIKAFTNVGSKKRR